MDLPEYVGGLPNLSGAETEIERAIADAHKRPLFRNPLDLSAFDAAAAIALHMHQPLIPAGNGDVRTAAVISNLAWMMQHPDIGDNHNAPVFRWCYKRMGEFVPQLLDEGHQPRVMLEYSGTLLHGLRQMGADDVIDTLRAITTDDRYHRCVEWLGCPWGHAVAPSTPVQDYRLHVKAWQHHFAAMFGLDALGRVRGFSPSEMALPNHPDVAYEFVRTLVDCGYEWVLVQEHTVEQPDGRGLEHPHLPHRLVCTNSSGATASIVAVIKTQGSDTKLVAQMQPWYEAKGLHPLDVAGHRVPPLVTQIADGENGGVMMNEFPAKYVEVVREASGTRTPLVNVSDYLHALFAAGVDQDSLRPIQPLLQHRIWERMRPGDGTERLHAVTTQLRDEDQRFHMDGGSWTNDISWVRGYDSVLIPMERASSLVNQRILRRDVPPDDPAYRNALFHLLTAETSCYRYWGEGVWTDYGAELARRTSDIATHDFPR